MLRQTFGFAAAALSVSLSVCAIAEEADFQITEDFLRICESSDDLNVLNEAFKSEGFIKASKDLKDVLTPDDFLTKVKKVKAWDITYPEGHGWYGVTAMGHLGETKVVHCGIMVIDDDPDGYRQDFDQAKEMTSNLVAKNDIEKRYLSKSSGAVYVMREVRTPAISYFVYTKNTPVAAKGK